MSAGTAAPSGVVAGGVTMIPQKFYHPNAGRHALGLVGGNEVSVASGNLVDVESDLRGITRDLTNCPQRMFQPSCVSGMAGSATPCVGPSRLVYAERGTGRMVTVNTTPRHLPMYQTMSYPGVPMPEPVIQEVHGAPWRF